MWPFQPGLHPNLRLRESSWRLASLESARLACSPNNPWRPSFPAWPNPLLLQPAARSVIDQWPVLNQSPVTRSALRSCLPQHQLLLRPGSDHFPPHRLHVAQVCVFIFSRWIPMGSLRPDTLCRGKDGMVSHGSVSGTRISRTWLSHGSGGRSPIRR